MAFKHRNQMMLEQHLHTAQVHNNMRDVLVELILESQMDIDQVRETFYDLFSEEDASMLNEVWDEVMDDLPELN